MKSWKSLHAPALVLATLFASGGSSLAEEPWKFKGTVFFDRAASEQDEDDDEPGSARGLQPRFGVGLTATRSYDLKNGNNLGLALGFRHERYPENPQSNRFYFDGGMYYTVPLEMGRLRQFQVGLNLRNADDEYDWVYNRARLETSVRIRAAPRNTIRLRTRVGYREQNDEHTFSGYDQAEYLFDVMHNWQSESKIWRTTSIVYFEHRQADKDQYTYDEAGARLIGRRELTEMTTLIGRTNAFIRDYRDEVREDQRLRGTLGLEFDLGHEAILEAFSGYERNWSTVEDKDYGGAVFGIQLSKGF